MREIKTKPTAKAMRAWTVLRMPGFAMKKAWLTKKRRLKKAIPLTKLAEDAEPQSAEQETVVDVENATVQGVSTAFSAGQRLAERTVEDRQRKRVVADGEAIQTALETMRMSLGQDIPPVPKPAAANSPTERVAPFYTIKSKPAGSVKSVSRSVKAMEPEVQINCSQPTAEGRTAANSAQPVLSTKRIQQAGAAVKAVKVTSKVTAKTAEAVASAVKELASLLIAGGWVSVIVVLLMCGIVMISVFLGGQEKDVTWQGTGIFEWPLPQNFTITSPFGERVDPITGEVSFHTGTDIAAPEGTPILAAADGTVTIANSVNPRHSYGYYVKIQHEDGFETLYAHCSAICVRVGQEVGQGEVVGFVGSTGDSTGNHLHSEVWTNGKRTDMMKYFLSDF